MAHSVEMEAVRGDDHKIESLATVHAVSGPTIAEEMGYHESLIPRFPAVAMICLSCTIMITWEAIIMTVQYGEVNGGPTGLIWSVFFCWAGYLLIACSLGELCSMFPAAGGQYQWAYELAPQRYKKSLSFMIGYNLVVGWQADLASCCYLGAGVIQGLAKLLNPEYDMKTWHAFFIILALAVLAFGFNTILTSWLKFAQWPVLAIHIVGWAVIFISLIARSSAKSNAEVWDMWLNLNGLPTMTLAVLKGSINTVFTFMGIDGVAHMTEDATRPRKDVPTAMVASVMINGVQALVTTVVYLYYQGDMMKHLESPTLNPFMEAFVQALGSLPWAVFYIVLLLATVVFAIIAVLAATSRATYALARDGALPLSPYLGRLRNNVPLNALIVSVLITSLLGLIVIGSTTAFSAVTSLVVASYYSGYFVNIAQHLWRRFRNTAPTPGPWNLGKFGATVNALALIYLAVVFVISFFPTTMPVTVQNMNWSCVLWIGTMVLGGLYYSVYLCKTAFTGPKPLKHD